MTLESHTITKKLVTTFNLIRSTQILSSETNRYKRKLLEGMYIDANKSDLVNLKSGTKLDNCWIPILRSIPKLLIPKSHGQPHQQAI